MAAKKVKTYISMLGSRQGSKQAKLEKVLKGLKWQ